MEDSLYWPLSHDGRYTCKSGYRFLKEEAESALERTQVAFETQLWKKLWMLEVPNKVKNHVWRACRDSLPIKQNLMQRTIITNPLCDRCKLLPETMLHVVWACPKLDEVWTDSVQWGFRHNRRFLDFKELLSWVIQEQRNAELFAMTVWSVWTQRNQARLHKPHCTLS